MDCASCWKPLSHCFNGNQIRIPVIVTPSNALKSVTAVNSTLSFNAKESGATIDIITT